MIKPKTLLVTLSFISLTSLAGLSFASASISTENCEALLQSVGTKTLPSTTDGMNTLQAISLCQQQVSTLNFAKTFADTYANLHAQSALNNNYQTQSYAALPINTNTDQQNNATPANQSTDSTNQSTYGANQSTDNTVQKPIIPSFNANGSTTEPTLKLTKEQQQQSNINWF